MIRRHNLFLGVALSAVALTISGCENQKEANAKFDTRSVDAENMSATQFSAASQIAPSPRHLLGDNVMAGTHGDPIPARLEGPNGFVWSGPPEQLTLAQFAQRVQKYSKMLVLFDDAKAPGGVAAPVAPAAAGTKTASAPGGVAAIKDDAVASINNLLTPQATGGMTARDVVQIAKISPYSGPLSGFLDLYAPDYGVDYDIRGDVVYLGKQITRQYKIVDFKSTTNISAGLSSASSGGSGSGGQAGSSGTTTSQQGTGQQSGTGSDSGSGGGQTSTTKTSMDSVKELLDTVKGIAAGGDVWPEASNGWVTVRCSLYCHGQLKAYIDNHNKSVGRTVLVTLAILTTQRNGADDYGFSPTLLYKNLPTGYGVSVLGQALSAAPPSAPGTSAYGSFGTITGAVVNAPAGSSAAKFNGTDIALQALSTNQTGTSIYHKYLFIGNNKPFSLRNALDYQYFTQIGSNVGTTLAQTTTQITTSVIGDQIQIIPRIQNDGYIRLSLTVSRTSIQSFSQATVDGVTDNVPQVQDDSGTPQEFSIPDGSTVILSDVTSDTTSNAQSGSGAMWNWVLGGSAQASNSKQKALIIITAREWHASDEMPTYVANGTK